MQAVPGLAGRGMTAHTRCGPVVVGSGRATQVPVGAVAAGESELAVLVLQTSWALADAAHDLPAGRLPARRRAELADTLQALGFVLRVTSAPEGKA